jgi:glycosyltransferase involved in cell wall biosynthesis
MMPKKVTQRGIGICHYNRLDTLDKVVKAVLETAPEDCRVVIADDGSDGDVAKVARENNVILLQGPNAGVAANKNRALWALQDCQFITLLEDDLMPTEKGWFEQYESAAAYSSIHHFCRGQKRLVAEAIPSFGTYMASHGLTMCYGPSPRGDFTFLTSAVLARVGGFNPRFRGAGHAHGEWSHRVLKAELIPHPNKWVDVVEAGMKFEQIGDTTGGRWNLDSKTLKRQMERNKAVYKELTATNYIYHPLVLE